MAEEYSTDEFATVFNFDQFWFFFLGKKEFGPYESQAQATRMHKLYEAHCKENRRID